jgi:hypothetical protein
MIMSNREDMIAEATDLGLSFKGNISNIKLATLINEYKGMPAPIDETPPPGPAVKADAEPEEAKEEVLQTAGQKSAHAVYARKRAKIAKAKKAAFKTKIVTLTNKDNRENDVATTAFLSFENQYFGLAKNVPLDIPVELEVSLIDIAETCMITLHKDEIVAGRRTGNKLPVRVKKYAISYGQQQPD